LTYIGDGRPKTVTVMILLDVNNLFQCCARMYIWFHKVDADSLERGGNWTWMVLSL